MNAPEPSLYLSPEVFLNVFSYLGPKDLVNAGTVSREWYAVQNTKQLWERHCQDSGQGPAKTADTWKQQFIILTNWKKSNYQFKKNEAPYSCMFCIIDKKHYEIFHKKHMDGSQCFCIHNVTDNETKSINVNSEIISKYQNGNKFVIINSNGVISCFDIVTGDLLNEVKTDIALKGRNEFLSRQSRQKVDVLCNESKIIMYLSTEYNDRFNHGKKMRKQSKYGI